jgi:hypothetical protein
MVQGMNTEILNWPGPPWEADNGGVKRSGKGESVGVGIHMHGNNIMKLPG